MILYLDASAIVKLYLDEPDSPGVAAAFDRAEAVASCVVAYAEVRAALAAALRGNRLTNPAHQVAKRHFSKAWGDYLKVGAADELIETAADLAEAHALRGFDAIHLAAAFALREQVQDVVGIAVADGALRAAALAEGFVIT